MMGSLAVTPNTALSRLNRPPMLRLLKICEIITCLLTSCASCVMNILGRSGISEPRDARGIVGRRVYVYWHVNQVDSGERRCYALSCSIDLCFRGVDSVVQAARNTVHRAIQVDVSYG